MKFRDCSSLFDSCEGDDEKMEEQDDDDDGKDATTTDIAKNDPIEEKVILLTT